jgi:hypothetical protein
MLIEGPLRIRVVDKDDLLGSRRELHLDFNENFQNLTPASQYAEFEAYVQRLARQIEVVQADTPDRRGMLIILQIAEQLLPHVAAREIPLDETIVVEIGPDDPFGSQGGFDLRNLQ